MRGGGVRGPGVCEGAKLLLICRRVRCWSMYLIIFLYFFLSVRDCMNSKMACTKALNPTPLPSLST